MHMQHIAYSYGGAHFSCLSVTVNNAIISTIHKCPSKAQLSIVLSVLCLGIEFLDYPQSLYV